MEIEGQLSFNDLFAESIPMGLVDETKVGSIIPFQKLKDYKDKKVVYQSFYGTGDDTKTYYSVVLIKDYYEGIDTYYKNELDDKIYNDYIRSISSNEIKKHLIPVFSCDRIAYTDDNRTKKTNSWLSEVYCLDGWYQIYHNSSTVRFHELKVM